MYIEGIIKSVLECPYKEDEIWCELELETLDHAIFTVMIPANTYKFANHDLLKEGNFAHVTGQVIQSSQFVIAWHISIKNGVATDLVFEK
ncbi:MAG: hypothetical protein Q4C49_02085 [Bacillota bacterium]|nr:hypothetical protein [Bacillota bacterium]